MEFHTPIEKAELPLCTSQHHILFQELSPTQITFLLTVILNEGKLVLLDTSAAKLTICLESLLSLIFPFVWPHVYVPVLPLNMLLFFEAPLPFIFGVFKEALSMVDIPENTVIVDLTSGSVRINGPWRPVPLPKRRFEELSNIVRR